jgi:hypothetical protein
VGRPASEERGCADEDARAAWGPALYALGGTVHRRHDPLRDEAGVESEVRLFGSTVEKDGAWKVFSCVVDD